MDRLKHA
jgi:hypothetical protein